MEGGTEYDKGIPRDRGGADKQAEEEKKRWKRGKCMKKRGIRMRGLEPQSSSLIG